MNTSSRKRITLVMVVIASLLLIAGIVAWQLRSIEHLANGTQRRTFELNCDFGKFRQIMVRKNATGAIVGHSGMKLLDERIQDLELDTSADDRPLLNAIRGQSKTNVTAKKEITVELDDPMLEATELVLRQNARIQERKIEVRSVSRKPAGRLIDYETTLNADPTDDGTKIELTVNMNVRVKVPKYFTDRADQGVQEAADRAIDGQVEAIKDFIDEYANDRFIIPDLNR